MGDTYIKKKKKDEEYAIPEENVFLFMSIAKLK